jgi:undecaprenyl-phosphate 4-deoxy-4-formamido-L-arabinose transferase
MAQRDAFGSPLGVVDAEPPPAPELSVVVTAYNEAPHLEELYRRLTAVLEQAGYEYELVFVDDGSVDYTFAELERLHGWDRRVRAVRLKRNFGRRGARHDSWGRTLPSRLINGMLRRFTGVAISDFGCAFNAYRRDAVTPMLGSIGKQKFTKALVLSGGASVVEVDVSHSSRRGASRYSPFRLTRLALHVLAGFWPQPIQWIGMILGVVCTLVAAGLGAYGVWYWIDHSNFPGPLFGGVAVLFVLGIQGFILALVGEYLARIQRDVEGRPIYTVDRELG